MVDEYVDPEFPEMESQPEEIPEPDGNPEPEVGDGEIHQDHIVPDELREKVDLELIKSSPDAQEIFLPLECPPQEATVVMSPDSGGELFLPGDDPLQQPVISEPLDPPLVYNRPVSKRLRHLTCERRGSEYHKPIGFHRSGG